MLFTCVANVAEAIMKNLHHVIFATAAYCAWKEAVFENLLLVLKIYSTRDINYRLSVLAVKIFETLDKYDNTNTQNF